MTAVPARMAHCPAIIQGGMGAGVSDWRLARAVSIQGQLGVISGTALDAILARRLQMGDPGGHMRRGLEQFPVPAMAERIWQRYYIAGGKGADRPFAPLPLHQVDEPRELTELCIVSNFVETVLARDGHANPVGVNYLEKIQLPHLPSIYGAMLAGVRYVLMGAGIPTRIPGVLDRLAHHAPVRYPLPVTGALEGEATFVTFDPRAFVDLDLPPLDRPAFLAIVSSHVLAAALLKRADGEIDGFVVEGPTAGGHNAPPRGQERLNDAGEPVYGERDRVDLDRMVALQRPFWLAGGYGSAEKLAAARASGAAGVQVGTAFAFCAESGLRSDYKDAVLSQVQAGTACVFTDPLASPTSFPFKVTQLAGTISDPETYRSRARVCDLGYLREAFRQDDGSIGYRCAAEPVSAYVGKGGSIEDTVGRKCICNALVAAIGLAQTRGRQIEPAVITSGDDLAGILRFRPPGAAGYSAADVIAGMLGAERG